MKFTKFSDDSEQDFGGGFHGHKFAPGKVGRRENSRSFRGAVRVFGVFRG
jgi:hypothetical protein